jgi:hypothetical protein
MLIAGVALSISAIVLGLSRRKTTSGRDGLVIGIVTLVLVGLFVASSVPVSSEEGHPERFDEVPGEDD